MAVDQATPQASTSNGKRARESSPAANASTSGSKTYTGYEASLYPMAGPSQPKKKAKKGEPEPEQAEKRAKLYRKGECEHIQSLETPSRVLQLFCGRPVECAVAY